MYDFSFIVCTASMIADALSGVRKEFRKQFSGRPDVRLKSITITPVVVPGHSNFVKQNVLMYVVVGIVESDEQLVFPELPEGEAPAGKLMSMHPRDKDAS